MPGEDDPLKLLLELDAKVRGLLGLDKQLAGVAKTAAAAQKHLEKLAGDLKEGLGHAVGHAREKINEFGGEALGVFAGLTAFEGVKKLAEGVFELGKELVTTAAHAQRTETSFKLLLGAEKGSDLLEYLDQISGATEFDDDQLKGMAQALLKVGVAADKVPDMIAAGLDIAAFTGAGVEGLNDATAAFQRLTQTGQLDFRVLKGLGIEKGTFMRDFAKDVGMGVKELEDKLSKGKIEVETITQELYKSITKRTGLDLGGAGVKVGEGLEAKLTHLKNLPEDIFKAVGKGPAVEQLAGAFDKILGVLGPDGAIGKKLVGGLSEAFIKFADWLSKVDIDKLTGQLVEFWDTAKTVFSFFSSVFGVVADIFDFVGTTIGETVAAIYLFFEDLVGIGEKIGDFFGDLYVKGSELGTRLWEGLKNGILGGITAVGDAVGSLASSAIGKVKGLLGIHSPSAVFMEMGDMTGEGYARGVLGAQDRVDAAVGDTFNVEAPGAAAAPRAIGGGQISITIPITVNYAGDENPRTLAQEIQEIMPGTLQAALEQLRLELGVT